MTMDDVSSNLSKCCKCNDAPGDFLLDSCLHNICNYCVATCLDIRDIYNCPKCLTKSKISPNIYLSVLNRQSVEKCNWCEVRSEESIATGYCSECDIHLCPECQRGHCRMPQFRSHNVQHISEGDGQIALRNCDAHPNEALEIYCQTCEKLTCRDCQLSLHKEHKHQWIGEKAREMEQILSELRNKMTEKIAEIQNYSQTVDSNRDRLFDNVKLTRTDLKKYVEEFRKCQDRYFEDLEKRLDEEVGTRDRKLVEVGKDISRSLEIMQHCSNLLSKISTNQEHSSLIQMTPCINKSLTSIINQFDSENQANQMFLDPEYCENKFTVKKHPNQVFEVSANSNTEQFCQISFSDTVKESLKMEWTISPAVDHNRNIATSGGTEPEIEMSIYDMLDEEAAQWPLERVFCSVCGDAGMVISCAKCTLLFHQACHVPRLAQLPVTGNTEWTCSICLSSSYTVVSTGNAAPSNSSGSTVVTSPQKGRLSKKERKVVASIFLEILQYHDWTIFLADESNASSNLKQAMAAAVAITQHNNNNGTGLLNGNPLLSGFNHPIKSNNDVDLDKIRFRIENKEYTSVDQFIVDMKLLFKETAERTKSPSVKYRVSRFQQKLDSLLKKYIVNCTINTSVLKSEAGLTQ